MASGVFAGDATRMSLKSCFPRIHEVESEYGSLIRGLISLRKKARQAGSQGTPGPGPGGLLTSFRGGMSELTDTLTAGLGDRVRFEAGVESLSLSGGKFEAHLVGGGSEEFDVVVLAAPAWAQARILRDMAPRIAAEIAGIEYPALAVVCMGYERARAGDCLDGFGFLVPSRERRGILGTVVDSNVFPERAPADRVLLRTMVGGARASQLAEEPENRILDLVRADLADILGVDADPEFVRVCRHQRAIPQYLVGHAARLESIGQGLLQYPGLFLTGNAYRGVSLNDCVLNASSTARAVLDHKGAGGARR
jgi:oxygen-dependent protoporphyrinogen oxidase